MFFWFDLCHPPHVVFFAQMIHALEKQGHHVHITYRNRYQVKALMDMHGLQGVKIGGANGGNRWTKSIGLIVRSVLLYRHMRGKQCDLAVSQGSSYQVIAAHILGFRSLFTSDYEHIIWTFAKRWATAIAVSELIPLARLKEKNLPLNRIHRYPGLKEEVYLDHFQPSPGFLKSMGWQQDKILVIVRPPEVRAHYHNAATEDLYQALMRHLARIDNAFVIILPRSKHKKRLLEKMPGCIAGDWVIPEETVDGPALIYYADLVISGGGTMNREAAALGVPVYSIFHGKTPSVDLALEQRGLLTRLTRVEQVPMIPIEKRRHQKPIWKFEVKPFLIDLMIQLAAGRELLSRIK